MGYEINDVVKIKTDLKVGVEYGDEIFVKDMEEYCGQYAQVDSLITETKAYSLSIDGHSFHWSEEMLEPSVWKQVDNKTKGLSTSEREFGKELSPIEKVHKLIDFFYCVKIKEYTIKYSSDKILFSLEIFKSEENE